MKKGQFLGIYIDENLTWRHHIANINKIIASALFSINQAKRTLPKDCLRTLYYSLIHSHLSYGLLTWENRSRESLCRAVNIQKRAIRTIHNANSEVTRTHYSKLVAFGKSQINMFCIPICLYLILSQTIFHNHLTICSYTCITVMSHALD